MQQQKDTPMHLTRVLENEVMDTRQEANDYDAMDHSEVNRRFVQDLLDVGLTDGDVLDLGTGTALIPIELCQRNERCRVMAADAAVSMLELARINVEVAGLRDRIILSHLDAKQIPFGDETFHAVISNSIIHHIPDPVTVLAEAVRVAVPGGLLFFRDLLRPPDDATVRRLVDTYAADANDHQRKMFDDSLRAALDLEEIRGLITQVGLDPAGVQATSDRHWTWCAHK
jgi:ubiquinone/menaquinone biosynthesis C-methylase UbiE